MIYRFMPNKKENGNQILIFMEISLVGFIDTEKLPEEIVVKIRQGHGVKFTLLPSNTYTGLVLNQAGSVTYFDHYIMCLQPEQMSEELINTLNNCKCFSIDIAFRVDNQQLVL
jgi:hypothetical protein